MNIEAKRYTFLVNAYVELAAELGDAWDIANAAETADVHSDPRGELDVDALLCAIERVTQRIRSRETHMIGG